MRYALVVGIGTALAISGCAIHPLPEDYSRVNTFDIVQRIRCEARQAVLDFALTSEDKAKLDAHDYSGPGAAKIYGSIRPEFRRTAIGYSFFFTIFEINDASGNANFVFPFSNGSVSLNIGAGETRNRKAARTFDLAETFYELLADQSLICEPGKQNWKYPITGEVGLREVVKTFLRLSGISPSFQSPLAGSAPGTRRELYEFTDDLTFTTSFNGTVKPSLTLQAVPHDFRLTQANATFGATRDDQHRVKVALKGPSFDKSTDQRLARSRGLAMDPEAFSDPKTSVLRTLQKQRDLELLLQGVD